MYSVPIVTIGYCDRAVAMGVAGVAATLVAVAVVTAAAAVFSVETRLLSFIFYWVSVGLRDYLQR